MSPDPFPAEKFGQAVHTLLTADELLGGRLLDAFRFHISKVNPEKHELPEAVGRELRSVRKEIDSHGGEAAWIESLDDVAKQRRARWVLETSEALDAELD